MTDRRTKLGPAEYTFDRGPTLALSSLALTLAGPNEDRALSEIQEIRLA